MVSQGLTHLADVARLAGPFRRTSGLKRTGHGGTIMA
jgi:hypothetical protein